MYRSGGNIHKLGRRDMYTASKTYSVTSWAINRRLTGQFRSKCPEIVDCDLFCGGKRVYMYRSGGNIHKLGRRDIYTASKTYSVTCWAIDRRSTGQFRSKRPEIVDFDLF